MVDRVNVAISQTRALGEELTIFPRARIASSMAHWRNSSIVRAKHPRDFGCSVVVGSRSATMQSIPKRSSSGAIANPSGPPPTMKAEVSFFMSFPWERAAELVQVVVVVPGHLGDQVLDGQAAAARMRATPMPLLGRQRGEMSERPLA